MIYRKLGPTGIKVSAIGYGNWVNSNSKEAQQLTTDCVKAAWDLGINFFDTAESYGFGQAERQLGVALKSLNVPRHHLVVTTKIFFASMVVPTMKGLSRKHVIEGMKNSLKNLDMQYVDVVFCHRNDETTPIEEVCRAFDWIVRKGWAFYWGTSQWSEDYIAQAHMICDKYNLIKPVVEQPQYNILARDNMEVKYRRLFEAGKLGTTVWSPLASGVLTGKYNDGVPEGSRFDKNQDLLYILNKYFGASSKDATVTALNKFNELAKQMECSMAQLAMAWVVSNPDVSTALTGASRVQQLQNTVRSLELLPRMTPEVQKQIEEIFKTEPSPRIDHKTLGPIANRRRTILKY